MRPTHLLATAALLLALALRPPARADTPKFSVHEVALETSGEHANPYIELSAEALLTEPDGATVHTVPLFWDGGSTWRFRFSPAKTGTWRWSVQSRDRGLDGKTGSFTVRDSSRRGSIRPMSDHPRHFARQDGTPFWFLGDTAWALLTDSEKENHDGVAARAYLEARAAQGFNVVHSMLLSEAGWANSGGPPFTDIGVEAINPAYFQEVDRRVAHANSLGIICGLALAWGDKRGVEPYAWRRFPGLEARKRYARYVAARYSAHDVYFIVSGEWHAEVGRRGSATENQVRGEFIEIGEELRAADPHGRMVAIHPMTAEGSVREFHTASWMSFGDYQQNYRDLHARVRRSLGAAKPVVNSEYGYYLRDQDGDGTPDKDNSTSLAAMRHATWDIVLAGGYVVTGFGTTYFGGNRDPGPFDLRAPKNRAWEDAIGHVARFFRALPWWNLEPADDLLRCAELRSGDRRELGRLAPPRRAYWCLAAPGEEYVVYARGVGRPIELSIATKRPFEALLFDPRTGRFEKLPAPARQDVFEFRPPDRQDWVVRLKAEALPREARPLRGRPGGLRPLPDSRHHRDLERRAARLLRGPQVGGRRLGDDRRLPAPQRERRGDVGAGLPPVTSRLQWDRERR